MSRLLLCLADHPTQYDPPLWDRMAQRGRVRPLVWYVRSTSPDDPEIRRTTDWGISVGQHYSATTVTKDDIIPRLQRLNPPPQAILTAGWTRRASWSAVWGGKRRGIPIILPTDKVAQGLPAGLPRRAASFLLHALGNRLFDGFLTTGALGIASLRSTGVPRWRIATGLYPVDVAWWQARKNAEAEFSRALRGAAGTDAFVVAAVCKLSPREDPLALLQAFALLQKKLPRAYFYLVGDGPLRPQVENRIQELFLSNRVCLCGYIPYPKLAAYYGAADVFVHAPQREPWGISVAEAMACGVPVVATSLVGSAHDLIVSGKTGELVPPGNPQVLANTLTRWAETRRRREDVQASVLEQVRIVDVDCASREIEDLIDRLRQRRTAPSRERNREIAHRPMEPQA